MQKEVFDLIILSGGGTKAIAALGVLHYFYELGMIDLNKIQDYPGTSAGSLIHILLICGYTPMEIMKEIYQMESFFDTDFSYNIWEVIVNYGLLDIEIPISKVKQLVIKKFGYVPTLKELKTKTGRRLIAPAFNVTDDELVYLTPESHPNILCTDVGKLSSKLPFIFKRVEYEGKYYEDGGLGDNFPIDCVNIKDKKVLGIMIMGTDPNITTQNVPFISYLYRIIMRPINTNSILRTRYLGSNVTLVKLNLKDSNIIESSIHENKKMSMFMAGYREAEREMKKERLKLNWYWDDKTVWDQESWDSIDETDLCEKFVSNGCPGC